MNYIKMSPLTGMVGYGGGASSLACHSGGCSDPTWYGDRGIFAGGESNVVINTIQYVDITSTGNTTDFGDLNTAKRETAGSSGSCISCFVGGDTSTNNSGMINEIEYISPKSLGNGTDFGNLTAARDNVQSASSGTRGVFLGGSNSGVNNTDHIQYITFATPGNATSFGSAIVSHRHGSGVSNGTRGVYAGGDTTGDSDEIEYLAFDTAANSSAFGDLSMARNYAVSGGNTTRGVWVGGYGSVGGWGYKDRIDYVTIASTSNASDFGNLGASKGYMSSGQCGNNTRALFGGGTAGSPGNTMEYITVATLSNADDFGLLDTGTWLMGSTANPAS